jgi:5-methylcytosine-specific restriction protein A
MAHDGVLVAAWVDVTTAPPRPCSRCGRLVIGRCLACTRRRDEVRGSAASRGYDEAWARTSRAWLARRPWCGQRLDGRLHTEHSRCAQRGERVAATCTDHIVAIRDGGSRLDPMNHQSLCTSCNTAKDARRGPRE